MPLIADSEQVSYAYISKAFALCGIQLNMKIVWLTFEVRQLKNTFPIFLRLLLRLKLENTMRKEKATAIL